MGLPVAKAIFSYQYCVSSFKDRHFCNLNVLRTLWQSIPCYLYLNDQTKSNFICPLKLFQTICLKIGCHIGFQALKYDVFQIHFLFFACRWLAIVARSQRATPLPDHEIGDEDSCRNLFDRNLESLCGYESHCLLFLWRLSCLAFNLLHCC